MACDAVCQLHLQGMPYWNVCRNRLSVFLWLFNSTSCFLHLHITFLVRSGPKWLSQHLWLVVCPQFGIMFTGLTPSRNNILYTLNVFSTVNIILAWIPFWVLLSQVSFIFWRFFWSLSFHSSRYLTILPLSIIMC